MGMTGKFYSSKLTNVLVVPPSAKSFHKLWQYNYYSYSHHLCAGSAISVALLGVAYFANIHALWYFIVVQVFGGIMQVGIIM